MSIHYSDGDAIERKIQRLLQQSSRLGSLDFIGLDQYSEWAVRYHLSPYRSNLLRHLNFKTLRVLELGAGMGGMSRYLAENASYLKVVEGTEQRFSALRERLRDLTNWDGAVANITDYEDSQPYDVVCCIGVLEYSERFVTPPPGETPFTWFLKKALEFLKPDGVLILAIENRLGIKYWNATPEDHLGTLYDNICGYSRTSQARTFSRQELISLLHSVGVKECREYFPFPDYKIVHSVLSGEIIRSWPEISASIAAAAPFENYLGPRNRLFPDRSATRSVARAGLLSEFSNSFLFMGSQSLESPVLSRLTQREKEPRELAWHYSLFRQVPSQTTFYVSNGNHLWVNKASLIDPKESFREFSDRGLTLRWKGGHETAIAEPNALMEWASEAYFKRGTGKEHDFLDKFFEWSFSHWRVIGNETHLQGQSLDALITNACVSYQSGGSFEGRVFDLEFEASEPIAKTWFILRNLLALRSDSDLFSGSQRGQSVLELYRFYCNLFSLVSDFDGDSKREAQFQSLVTPDPFKDKLEQVRFTCEAPFTPSESKVSLKKSKPYLWLSRKIIGFLKRIAKRQYFWLEAGENGMRYSLVPSGAPQLAVGFMEVRLAPLPVLAAEQFHTLKCRSDRGVFSVRVRQKKGSKFIRQILKLSHPVTPIELELTDTSSLDGERLSFRMLSKPGAAMRLLLPQLPAMVRRPSLFIQFLKNGWSLVLQGRRRGLIAWIQQQAVQGPVASLDEYSEWCQRYDTLTESDRTAIRNRIEAFKASPLISVLMPVYNTDERWLRAAIESVVKQLYPHWELCIVDDASTHPAVRQVLQAYERSDPRVRVRYRSTNGHISQASNDALQMVTGEFIALLDHDDELTEHALYHVVEALNKDPLLDFIYTDEDKIDVKGRRFHPHFKSEWNEALLCSYNMVTHLSVFRTAVVRNVGGFRTGFEGSQDYDLVFRVAEVTRRILHLPYVLYHWRSIPGSVAGGPGAKHYALANARKAIQEHLDRSQVKGEVTPGYGVFHRVCYALPDPLPMVSMIICTRDRVDLLEKIVDGILNETDYSPIELIIVNNQSSDPRTLQYLGEISKDSRVTVLDYPHPFNFAAMNNLAVEWSRGEFVLFLNNDLEVMGADWLKEMIRLAVLPRVGVVGAKLYFPDGRVQHAGVVLGVGGVAGHSHKWIHRAESGYVGRLNVIQEFSAVTGACLLASKRIFQEVGGFDAVHLPVAFNDIDFCLKVRTVGYKILWTPYAELYHCESASRGSDETPENRPRFLREERYMLDKWGEVLKADPAYNPNLSLEYEDFRLGFPPRVEQPWRATTRPETFQI